MATVYKGESANVGFAFETEDTEFDTLFTPGAQTGTLGIMETAELSETPMYKDAASTASRDLSLAVQGRIAMSGTLPISLQNGRAFYLAMGSVVNHGAVGALYGHTVTGAATAHIPSLVMESVYSGTNKFLRVYRGVKFESLTMSGLEGGDVSVSAMLKACKSVKSTATPSVYAVPGSTIFLFCNGTLTFASQQWALSDFNFMVTNNLDERYTTRYYDQQYPYMLQERQRKYSLKCSIVLEDSTSATTFYDYLKAGTESDVVLGLTSGSKLITLTASACKVRSAPHGLPEVGEAIEIPVELVPKTCSIYTVDEISNYTVF